MTGRSTLDPASKSSNQLKLRVGLGGLNPPGPSGRHRKTTLGWGHQDVAPPCTCSGSYTPKPSQKPCRPLCSPPRPPRSPRPLRGAGDRAAVGVCVCCAPEGGVEGRDADVSKFPLIRRQSGPRDPHPPRRRARLGTMLESCPSRPSLWLMGQPQAIQGSLRREKVGGTPRAWRGKSGRRAGDLEGRAAGWGP